jgi:hypothetical protein
MNYDENSKFYFHIDTENLHDNTINSILEVNGSYEPSKLRATLFMTSEHL